MSVIKILKEFLIQVLSVEEVPVEKVIHLKMKASISQIHTLKKKTNIKWK